MREELPEGYTDKYITTYSKENGSYIITNTKPGTPEKTTSATDGKIKVGDVLTYTIKWTNNTGKDVKVTIKDTLAKGQEYVSGDEGVTTETVDGKTVVSWKDVEAAKDATVTKSFKVKVTEDAAATVENKAVVKVGDNVEIETNTTEVTPTIDISGEKKWVGDKETDRPDEITVKLYAKGEYTGKSVKATKADNWKYEFKNLPNKDKDGKIKYSVKEELSKEYADKYISTYSKDENGSYIITNTKPDTPKKTASTSEIGIDKEFTYTIEWKNTTGKDVTVTITDKLSKGQDFVKGEGASYDPQTRTVTWKDVKVEAGGTLSKSFTAKLNDKAVAKEENKATINIDDKVSVDTNTTEVKPLIDISGIKTWSGDEEADRPQSITVRLMNGSKEVASKTVTANDEWKYTFEDVPEYDSDGKAISYTIKEDSVKGYVTSYDGYNIINYKPGAPVKTSSAADNNNEVTVGDNITYTIEWKNTTGEDVTATITDKLAAGQEYLKDNEINKNNGAEYKDGVVTWKDVNVKKGETFKQSFVVKVTEEAEAIIENKAVVKVGDNVEIETNTTEITTKVNISGTKTWVGGDKDSRPAVTLKLTRAIKGGESETVEATPVWSGIDTNVWTYKYSDLARADENGNIYTYTVKEVPVKGYVATYDGNNIINTKPDTPEKTANDKKTEGEITVGDKVTYTIKWKNNTGKDVTATIKDTLKKGQEYLAAESDKDAVYDKAAGTVSWNGVTIKDGETFEKSFVVRVTDEAEAVVENTAKVLIGDNVEIETNTTEITTKIDISGTKTWKNDKASDRPDPEKLELKLTRAIKGGESETVEATPVWSNTDKNVWTYKYSDLERADKDGNIYTYTVKEVPVKGYVATYDGNNIINTKPDTPEKTANGKTEGEITVGDEITYTIKWTNNTGKDVKATIKDTLTKGQEYLADKSDEDAAYDKAAGTVSWKDVTIKDGDTFEKSFVVRVTDEAEAVVENTAKVLIGDNVEISTNPTKLRTNIDIKGKKVWVDGDDINELRPDKITVNLKADGKVADSKEVTADESGKWNFVFSDKPKYDDEGKLITYTVDEETVENYDKTIDGTTITNTLAQVSNIKVEGEKTWKDDNNSAKTRPDKITVRLMNGSKEVRSQTVTADDNWKYVFDKLDKYDEDFHVIEYTVEEDPVEGYITTIDGYNITNSKPIKTVKGVNDKNEVKVGDELTYTISWTNASKEAVTAAIKDTLTKGQEFVSGDDGYALETKDGITTVKWENVAVGAGSKVEKTFTVKVTKDAEETIDNTAVIKVGDKPEVESNTTSVTPKIDISGEKIWKDKDNYFKLRPDSVEITLFADGEKTDKTEATKDSEWKYSFSDLPLYKDGKKIEYTVEETPVENYLDPEYEVVNKDGDANKINIINSIDEDMFSWTGDITVDKAVAVKVDNEYKPQKVTDTFYFALFSDKDLTKRATMKSEDGSETEIGIEKLVLKNAASGTVTFKDIPVGTIKEPVKYYVAETDKDGKPVGEGSEYTPEFGQSGNEVTFTVKDHKAELNVANIFDNKTSVSGQKSWEDNNDKYKQRPDDITVILKQNGEDYRDAQQDTYTVHASKDTDWAYTFKDLPKFDENGDLYEYTVDEEFVKYYDAVIDGMDITNTFDKKQYYDDNPATITVTKEALLKGRGYKVNDVYYAGVFVDKDHTTLLADEDGAYIIPLILEDESAASYEFNVPYNEDGTATYYITEVTEDGIPVDKASGLKYKASVKGGKVTVSAEDSTASVTFTNTYEQPKVPKTGDSGLPFIWMLAGLMAAALAAAAWIIFGRRETRRL